MNIQKLLLFSIAFALPVTVFSQSDDEETRYYDVEIIIFKNVQVPKGKEYTLPVSLPPKDDEAIDFSSAFGVRDAATKFYEVTPIDKLLMTDKAAKIIESPYYELLVHQGWRQPGMDKDNSLSVWIRGGKVYGDEFISIDSQLSGTQLEVINQTDGSTQQAIRGTNEKLFELEGKITIVLARYLHTYADLIYRRPRLTLDQSLDNPELAAELKDSLDTRILDNYHMLEQRRMRSKSLHYLDHPEFSLLVYITPYVKPDITVNTLEATNG